MQLQESTSQEEYRRLSSYRNSPEYKRLREERRRRRRREVLLARIFVFGGFAVILIAVIVFVFQLFKSGGKTENVLSEQNEEQLRKTEIVKIVKAAPDFDVQLLTPNEYSRPQIPTEEIKNLVVHYTANPGTTAQQNRNFFESLKDTHETSVSSHFVIGMDGEIIQCIPTSERAYASNDRNFDTVSIECCHPDSDGKFTKATYESLIKLTAYLCGKFNLEADDIIRHYDVTGKACPKFYVENEEAWNIYIKDVKEYIEEYGEEVEVEIEGTKTVPSD